MVNPLSSENLRNAAARFERAERSCLLLGGLTVAVLLGHRAALVQGHVSPLTRPAKLLSGVAIASSFLALGSRTINSSARAQMQKIMDRASRADAELSPREAALALAEIKGMDDQPKIDALRKLIGKRSAVTVERCRINNTPIIYTRIRWDARILLGEANWKNENELMPPLLQKTLMQLFTSEKAQDGIVIDLASHAESSYSLEQLLPLIRQFNAIPNLVSIRFRTYARTEAECQTFSDLLDKCPRLVDIPFQLLADIDTRVRFPAGVPTHVTALDHKLSELATSRKLL